MLSFPDLVFTAGKIRIPDSPEKRNTSCDRLQVWKCRDVHMDHMLKAYGTLKVTDSHVCIFFLFSCIFCIYPSHYWRKARIFQNDLKSQKKIPRCVIVFG